MSFFYPPPEVRGFFEDGDKLKQKNMYAVIDVETGGFNVKTNALCEIAVIVLDSEFKEVTRYEALIKPYISRFNGKPVVYNVKAMNVNGISMSQLKNGIQADMAARDIQKILLDNNVRCIIGHNVLNMDKKWTEYFLRSFDYPFVFQQYYCTLESARKMDIGTSSNSLPVLLNHFGIVNNNPHRAMGDTEATMKLFFLFNGIEN